MTLPADVPCAPRATPTLHAPRCRARAPFAVASGLGFTVTAHLHRTAPCAPPTAGRTTAVLHARLAHSYIAAACHTYLPRTYRYRAKQTTTLQHGRCLPLPLLFTSHLARHTTRILLYLQHSYPLQRCTIVVDWVWVYSLFPLRASHRTTTRIPNSSTPRLTPTLSRIIRRTFALTFFCAALRTRSLPPTAFLFLAAVVVKT